MHRNALSRKHHSVRLAPVSNAPVAQLDRVIGFEPIGREFESLRARQMNKPATAGFLFVDSGAIDLGSRVFSLNKKEKGRLVDF